MKHQKNQSGKSYDDFLAIFKSAHESPRGNQLSVIKEFPKTNQILLQAPTGTGKTALGFTFLKGHCGKDGNGFYICPSKTLVDQVSSLYPEITPMYGRNEYACLYYESKFKADEIPCSVLKECPHRVDLSNGETFLLNSKPCPYLLAKFKSRQSSLVACTTNYYFFEVLSKSREKMPDAIVIDEAHEFSNSIRRMLSYNITDLKLDQFWELLSFLECRLEAKQILFFKEKMMNIIKDNYTFSSRTTILKDDSLKELLKILLKLERNNIDEKIKKAIADKKVDLKADRELLRDLDIFTNDLYRYIRSIEFALETNERKPLGYVFGYWNKKKEEGKKSEHTLTIQSYRMAGLTQNKLLPEKYLAYSATIGSDARMLQMDTGIGGKFIDLQSEFPIANSLIFMPDDVSDLSFKGSRHNDKNKTMRKILSGCKSGKNNGIRSLIIVISEKEREKCVKFAEEEGLIPISYSNAVKPKEAVTRFRNGEGDVLIGTEAQFGQGIDLPDELCGFIFYLRPGYPTPENPQVQFEERIYGNNRWSIWTWRVILKMLQARGRNQRSATDKGCIFLMSAQFKRFTYGGLPEWMRPAYVGQISFEKSIEKGIEMLNNGNKSTPLSLKIKDDKSGLDRFSFKGLSNYSLLTKDQEKRLAQKIEKGDEKARTLFIQSNYRLVLHMVKRYRNNENCSENNGFTIEDLFQEGVIGLIKAVEKFNWRMGFRFSTYAEWWILQSIKRSLMNYGRTVRIPVNMAEKYYHYVKIEEELYQKLCRKPTPSEIAKVLNVDVDVVHIMEEIFKNTILSKIDDSLYNNGSNSLTLGDTIVDYDQKSTDSLSQENELRGSIHKIILSANLSLREKSIIEMRYGLVDGVNHALDSIGKLFGVTRERIRQIEEKTLDKLKSSGNFKDLEVYLD